ncbi:O-methyltransferase [Falsibacillus albus]|uniref:O-methyltransferase n=2 Tax=Falsibacillus albus TaxID=2478915 RepID=A0A3L7JZW3_9BACI|nr:O-methyltransferase [Falsibacillus albus]
MLHANDEVMEEVLKENAAASLPPIDVSPLQGKFLHLLARLKGAKKILEIGTLGGYSTIWLARALPSDGRLITLEYEKKHADIARQNLKRAGVESKVEIMVGPAIDSLPKLKEKGEIDFDFVFIDADKVNNANYLAWALKVCRSGAVIIGDNVVRNGNVIDTATSDESVLGSREFIDLLSKEERIDSTAIQTVGSKGYDGFVMGIVK